MLLLMEIRHYIGTTEQASTILFIYEKYQEILLVPILYQVIFGTKCQGEGGLRTELVTSGPQRWWSTTNRLLRSSQVVGIKDQP